MTDERLLITRLAVVAGLTYNFLPFMTLPLLRQLERMDRRADRGGGDLYASPFTAFRKVTFPLSMPGVVAGTLLTFIPAAGDYINAELLGSVQSRMIGNVIDSRFLVISDYPTAAALSFVLLMARSYVLVAVYVRRGPAPRSWSEMVAPSSWVRDSDRVRPRRLLLPVLADLRGRPAVVQPAESRYNLHVDQFTWDNWLHPCAAPAGCASRWVSIQIAALATDRWLPCSAR